MESRHGVNNCPGQMSSAYYMENSYADPYRSGWVFMWAGGKRDPSTLNQVQGVILVNINPDPRQSGPANDPPPDSATDEYHAPNSPTWAKIVSVNGYTEPPARGREQPDLQSHHEAVRVKL